MESTNSSRPSDPQHLDSASSMHSSVEVRSTAAQNRDASATLDEVSILSQLYGKAGLQLNLAPTVEGPRDRAQRGSSSEDGKRMWVDPEIVTNAGARLAGPSCGISGEGCSYQEEVSECDEMDCNGESLDNASGCWHSNAEQAHGNRLYDSGNDLRGPVGCDDVNMLPNSAPSVPNALLQRHAYTRRVLE